MEDNQQKYLNYKEQMSRLNKALANKFNIEAIAIEYAIMEDRLESVLRHEGVYNPDKHNTLARKLSRVKELRRRKNSIENKYLSEELLVSIDIWKEKRNKIIHSLLKNSFSSEEFSLISEEGKMIVKQLTSKVTSIRRKLEKSE